jgi:hypothetical protein
MTSEPRAVIRNIAEVPWEEPPAHHGGALSKMLVRPETTGARRIDHRISCYRPMAYVASHAHKVQEQVYHVLDGEGLMEIAASAASSAATTSSSCRPASSTRSPTPALSTSSSWSSPHRPTTSKRDQLPFFTSSPRSPLVAGGLPRCRDFLAWADHQQGRPQSRM